jgi:hypothetical protein
MSRSASSWTPWNFTTPSSPPVPRSPLSKSRRHRGTTLGIQGPGAPLCTFGPAASSRRRIANLPRSRVVRPGPRSGPGGPDLVQPITKVRLRHHQVDQSAVLGARCTRHAQRARVSWANGALGLRLCSNLGHQDPSESSSCCPTSLLDLRILEHLFDTLEHDRTSSSRST